MGMWSSMLVTTIISWAGCSVGHHHQAEVAAYAGFSASDAGTNLEMSWHLAKNGVTRDYASRPDGDN